MGGGGTLAGEVGGAPLRSIASLLCVWGYWGAMTLGHAGVAGAQQKSEKRGGCDTSPGVGGASLTFCQSAAAVMLCGGQ